MSNRKFPCCGLIAGLVKIDFFSSRKDIYKVQVLPKLNMSALHSFAFTPRH